MSVFLCGMLLVFLVAGTSHASLTFAVVYDDVNNIFWLQDANMAGNSMIWNDATTWANSLDDGVWDDWRLPTIDELAHLYNVEDVSLNNPGPFNNMSFGYWSSTEYSPGSDIAWWFNFGVGTPIKTHKYFCCYVWAVHPGPACIPLPGAVWLLGLGMIGLAGLRRKLRG